MKALRALVDRIRREKAPDARSDIFEVVVEARADAIVLVGATTVREAADELIVRASLLTGDNPLRDEIVRLPDPALGTQQFGIVTAAVAPLYLEPALPAPQISQLVMGASFALLDRRGLWLRVRARDGYIGWLHGGYVLTGDEMRARGNGGKVVPAVSLGVELAGPDGAVVARLPWGAHVVREGAVVRLPDARDGVVASGQLVDLSALSDAFPANGDAVIQTARRWIGVPYLWGGLTFGGADCSGYVQAVLAMHGVALPRDSDMQAGAGAPIEAGTGFSRLRPGDLLFFAETGTRVSHVAFSTGGSGILHCALGNGGVAVNDLCGDSPIEGRLRAAFVGARRVVPD